MVLAPAGMTWWITVLTKIRVSRQGVSKPPLSNLLTIVSMGDVDFYAMLWFDYVTTDQIIIISSISIIFDNNLQHLKPCTGSFAVAPRDSACDNSKQTTSSDTRTNHAIKAIHHHQNCQIFYYQSAPNRCYTKIFQFVSCYLLIFNSNQRYVRYIVIRR